MGIVDITELPSFSKKIRNILTKKEKEALYDFLMEHPEKGDIIVGTGGIRKLRWAENNKGKRGGARIIYYYHVVGSIIYLMACYTKNEQSTISHEVKKQLKNIVLQIKERIS